MRVDQAEWWAEFKIFQDRDGRYYWQLEAASGRILAHSAQRKAGLGTSQKQMNRDNQQKSNIGHERFVE